MFDIFEGGREDHFFDILVEGGREKLLLCVMCLEEGGVITLLGERRDCFLNPAKFKVIIQCGKRDCYLSPCDSKRSLHYREEIAS